MRIKLNTSVAALTWSYAAGDEVEVPEDRGRDLIQAGHAEAVVVSAPRRETATKKNIGRRSQ